MENKVSEVTVQGVINPVPAALVSEKTGSQSSRSNYRNTSNPVAHLAELEGKTTGNTNKERWNMENPFRRNSGIPRSPPTTQSGSPQMEYTTSNGQLAAQIENSPGSEYFVELGNLISGLIEFMKDKNNVHHAIKEKARAIKAMYNKARAEVPNRVTARVPETSDKSSQTTTEKRQPEKDSKRARESEEVSTESNQAKRSKNTGETQKDMRLVNHDVTGNPHTREETNPWKTVKPKRKRRRKPKRKPRKRKEKKDVMIISTKGETSYADILKHIKSDPSLKDFGERVSRIRRTLKGDLLLEMDTNDKDSVRQFQGKVEKSVGMQANIVTRTAEILIECKDIDEITTKDDISRALNDLLGVSELRESDVRSLRKA